MEACAVVSVAVAHGGGDSDVSVFARVRRLREDANATIIDRRAAREELGAVDGVHLQPTTLPYARARVCVTSWRT